jgi:hypothetical protein
MNARRVSTTEADLQQQPPGLSSLLEFRAPHRHVWQVDDLRRMLKHLLAVPLQLSLGVLSVEVAHRLRAVNPPVQQLLSMGQLFELDRPPLELLKLVKRFAKLCRDDAENALPSELVMLMYYASIAVAMTRLGASISNLSDTALNRGLRWLAHQPWVDEPTRGILERAISVVGSSSQTGSGPPGV